ncbi:MAG: ABC transporter ATP-binding protein [PVC group bacterium]|nr:ABC transporter ATP-binding protein [PVC group bacterium]
MDKLLEIKNLKTYFQYEDKVIPAVDDVSIFIKKNSVLGLVGESGCGKTMTALSITRLLPTRDCEIVSGEIIFNGSNLVDMREEDLRDLRGRDIAYIFQEPSTSLNPVLSIKEQISEIVWLHRKDIENSKEEEFIIQQLQKVGIKLAEEKINFFPHQLSGGEKQRVMIAMAMVSKPKLIVADEPTTALDVTIQAQILDLLNELKTEYNLSILFISHDLNVIGELADYIAVMYAGQIVEFTDAKKLIKQPQHPYTKGLFDCLPERQSGQNRKLNAIAGEVPKADNFPQGCRFHPRCSQVFEKCKKEMPSIFKMESGQEVRCWLYSK